MEKNLNIIQMSKAWKSRAPIKLEPYVKVEEVGTTKVWYMSYKSINGTLDQVIDSFFIRWNSEYREDRDCTFKVYIGFSSLLQEKDTVYIKFERRSYG